MSAAPSPLNPINVNKIASQLALMGPDQLKQVALAHKGDQVVMPLIASISMQRQKVATAATPQPGEQPKVVDQVIGGLDAAMPEDQGIAQLPMQNPGYAEGGIIGYAAGGSTNFQAKFLQQYGPLAEKTGRELGVDPRLILSQWALESDWGRKTIGANNVGNIKDPSGKGPRAFDKVEGSRDSYKDYGSPEEARAAHAGLLKTSYPGAVGTGEDVAKFGEGLRKGKHGTYATDKDYEAKLAATYAAMRERVPATAASPASDAGVPTAANMAAERARVAPEKAAPGWMDRALGIPDAALSLGTGVFGTVAGLGAGAAHALTNPSKWGTDELAQESMGKAGQVMLDRTYTPRTQTGASIVGAAGDAANALRIPAFIPSAGVPGAAANAAKYAKIAAANKADAGLARLSATQARAVADTLRLTPPASVSRAAPAAAEEGSFAAKRAAAGAAARAEMDALGPKPAPPPPPPGSGLPALLADKPSTTPVAPPPAPKKAALLRAAPEPTGPIHGPNKGVAPFPIDPESGGLAAAATETARKQLWAKDKLRATEAERMAGVAEGTAARSGEMATGLASAASRTGAQNRATSILGPAASAARLGAMAGGPEGEPAVGGDGAFLGGYEDMAPAIPTVKDIPKEDRKPLIAEAKAAIPPEERKGKTDNQLLAFFLAMAAGKSQHFATNVGEAGLAALKYGQEQRRADRDDAKEAADQKLQAAQAAYYSRGPEAQRLAEWAMGDPKRMQALQQVNGSGMRNDLNALKLALDAAKSDVATYSKMGIPLLPGMPDYEKYLAAKQKVANLEQQFQTIYSQSQGQEVGPQASIAAPGPKASLSYSPTAGFTPIK